MASIKAAGNQTRLFKRAQSAEEKERLRLAAQKSPLPPAAGTAYPAYMGNPNPAGTAGSTPVSPAGTGGTANQAKNAYAQQQARQERDRIMTSGDTRAINQYLRQENMQRTADRLASAGNTQAAAQMQRAAEAQQRAAVLGGGDRQQVSRYLQQQAMAPRLPYRAAAQPAEMKDYTWWDWMGDNKLTNMSESDKVKWDRAVAGWNRGDYSAFNDDFETIGNWSSYVDANGKVNGMLRYVGDGIGGYIPVSNGRLLQSEGFSGDPNTYAFYGPNGEVYTADASGRLTRTGNWTREVRQRPISDGGLHGTFRSSNGQTYDYDTAPEDVLARHGFIRDRDGRVRIMDANDAIAYAVKSGQATPYQAALVNAALMNGGKIPAGSSRDPSGGSRPYEKDPERNTPTADPYVDPEEDRPQQQPVTESGPSVGTLPPDPTPRPAQTDWQAYLDEYDYGAAPEWEGSEYERRRDEALARAEGLRWDYDPDADPVWQAYQKQYRREGQRAAQDALGRYAAMTGGVPSSYAMTAASQAGDYYAAQLSDKLPELYDSAYSRYLRENERQLKLADAYEGYGKTEYDRYRDRLAQWNTDRAFRYGLNRDALSDARYADEQAYQRAWNEEAREYDRGRDALSDARYADELAYDRAWDEEARDYGRAYQQRRDAVSDERADRAWAQELREYADAQGWKTAEWRQYLREYGDKLSDQERQWAYEMAQDAEDRRLDAEETAWQRELRLAELAYDRERDAEADRRWETQYQQSLREYDDAQKQREFENTMKTLRASGGTEDHSAGSGGSGQRASGKAKTAASGKDAAENSGMVYSGTHPDGRKRTAGYGELKTILRNALMGGSRDLEQMRRMIDDWAAQGRIENYEVSILRQEFGLDAAARGGASGGKALQYTE